VLGDRAARYVGRDEAASPATGSYKLHEREQAAVIDRALRKRHDH
jgi:2-oxoglutarate dehydrogenase complex dehydrogenase (E1) component-like enzyme